MIGTPAMKVWNPWVLVLFVLALGVPVLAQGDEKSVLPRAELSVGLNVDRSTRTLVDPADVFSASVGQVYCLAHVLGARPPLEVTMVWYHEGRTKARVPLTVGSADYRTWSSKNIMRSWTGMWEVKVLDPKGLVLGEVSFNIAVGDSLAE